MSYLESDNEYGRERIGGAIVVGILVSIVLSLWVGFVLMTLWNWFISPTFVGLPRLGYVQAIGLDLVVSLLTIKRVAPSQHEETAWKALLMECFYTLLISNVLLVSGFILRNFM